MGPSRLSEDGITPIIGTLLLLVLMLTMIALILIIGTPQLNSLQTSTQYISTEGYFLAMSQDVRTTVQMGKGAAIESDIYIPTGRMLVEEDTDIWAMSYNRPDSMYDVTFEHLTDSSTNYFTVNDPTGGSISPMIEVTRLDSDPIESLGTFAGWGRINVQLEGVCSISIIDTTSSEPLMAQAMVFELGKVSFNMPTNEGTFHLEMINGQVASDYPRSPDIKDQPFFSDSSSSTNDHDIVINFVDVLPTGIMAAGSGDYTLQFNYAQSLSLVNQEVKNLRLYVGGDMGEAFYDSYSAPARHYHGNPNAYVGFIKDDLKTPANPDDDCVQYQVYDMTKTDSTGRVRLTGIYALMETEVID